MIINFSERAHNHNWDLDPIVRSLLDTDFYKLLMLQFIWKHFPATEVSFSLRNRNARIRLGSLVRTEEVIAQLEHVKRLRFRRSELIWLAGNTFYSTRGIFEPAFLDWLEHGFTLSDYELHERDGQLELIFSGTWINVTMWEIYALSIVNELKTRAALKGMSEFELDILYARAKTRLWSKIMRLQNVPGLAIADFGTRRRHSFLWQEYVVEAMHAELGDVFTGTSNTFLAYKHDLEAIGTNAHEIPMAMAALTDNDEDLKNAQYRMLELWQQTYGGALLVMLPDTYGTTQFLENAPDWVSGWTGQRVDSKDPFVAGDEYIQWLERRGADPRGKLLIASDGLDVQEILSLHAYFGGVIQPGVSAMDFRDANDFQDERKWRRERRIRFSAGWGTLLTNDFRDCHPRNEDGLEPISLVCKLRSAGGRPAVKLSDNYLKASGPPDLVAHYRDVFGLAGMANLPVVV
ncbi:nicotinate phosphoribosyltransferase [Terriglobus sp.]|uniref:nicotinate phosphoribosyltransferase n=1 Tax=Terriglobus sp. TaxID=1889013 RepID=UPI003AFFE2BE